MRKLYLTIGIFILLSAVSSTLFSQEDNNRILIAVHGWPGYGRNDEDARIDMFVWMHDIIRRGSGHNKKDSYAFDYRDAFLSSFVTSIRAKAAAKLAKEIIALKRQGKQVDILAHSQGTHITMAATLLVEYLRDRRNGRKLDPNAASLWNTLDKNTQKDLEMAVDALDANGEVKLIDKVITAGTPVGYDFSGVEVLAKNAIAFFNIVGRYDPVNKVSAYRGTQGPIFFYRTLIKDRWPGFFLSDKVKNISTVSDHSYTHPIIRQFMAELLSPGGLTLETAVAFFLFSNPEWTEAEAIEAFEELKRTGKFPPPPPPTPPSAGALTNLSNIELISIGSKSITCILDH